MGVFTNLLLKRPRIAQCLRSFKITVTGTEEYVCTASSEANIDHLANAFQMLLALRNFITIPPQDCGCKGFRLPFFSSL